MISESMKKSLNCHLAAEMHSADLYFGLACDFSRISLKGFSRWCIEQWREENAHILKMAEYIVDRGGEVHLEDHKAAEINWENPADAMAQALDHERLISDRINALVKQAQNDSDYATESFLRWYVDEQVEEEASLNAIVGKLSMVGDDPAGLVHCDVIMGKRKSRY